MIKNLKVADKEDAAEKALHTNESIKQLVNKRKKEMREPLSIAKVICAPSLDHLSEGEALEVVHSIQKLSVLLFEMHCHKESTFIDNQQVVSLGKQNKAA